MDQLISAVGATTLPDLLAAYNKAGIQFKTIIDGGAGSGLTAAEMLEHATADAIVYAFEPFPGNHRFFDGCDPRIQLRKEALADSATVASFQIPGVVSSESAWGQRGMAGYSSLGFLADIPHQVGHSINVECVRADDIIPPDRPVDLIKLDLQGGEFKALRGMSRSASTAKLMWVEYLGNENLIEGIENLGYLIFETEYLFLGMPTAKAEELFTVTRDDLVLSTGAKAWLGLKKRGWRHFTEEFKALKREIGLVQTDLVCVNRIHLRCFIEAMTYLQPAADQATN